MKKIYMCVRGNIHTYGYGGTIVATINISRRYLANWGRNRWPDIRCRGVDVRRGSLRSPRGGGAAPSPAPPPAI